MKKFAAALATIIITQLNPITSFGANMTIDKKYETELREFRKKAEERLRSPDSWLSVVGLSWLKEGDNTMGSAAENSVILPKSTNSQLGTINLSKSKITVRFADASNVMIDGKPAEKNKTYTLIDDKEDNPTKIKIGSVQFFLINRKNGIGVRIKDENADARTNFKGRQWYATNTQLIVYAKWVAFDKPHKIMVPDILGNLNEELSPGYAKFEIDGVSQELHPTVEDNKLFFVFRDKTSGKETYGAARFLYAEMPKGDQVTLDFNKAVNPPCAVTRFATCPMPPSTNILKVAIPAGELKPLVELH